MIDKLLGLVGLCRKSKFDQLVTRINEHEGGLRKRIDEVREAVELIVADAPELAMEKEWLIRWLINTDSYLSEIKVLLDKDGLVKQGRLGISDEESLRRIQRALRKLGPEYSANHLSC